MNKKEIEKNRLDLAYKRNLQLLNAVLFIGFGSFVTYLIGLILNPDKILEYTLIVFILAILTYRFYYKIDRNLRNISKKIDRLV